MTDEQKKALFRIVFTAVLVVGVGCLTHYVAMQPLWQLALWLIPYFTIGYDVLLEALSGIKSGEVFDENFLMAVATIGAMALGEYGEGVAVMLFYQIGEWFESYAEDKSRRSISELMDIRPDSANLLEDDGTVKTVSPQAVGVGDIVVVRPGEKIPLDGTVQSGESTLNTAALTGESKPRRVGSGDDVISGCINDEGVLQIRVTKPYGESTVAKILELVENSGEKKARVENFITRFAHYYTPAVCFAALVLAFLPPLAGMAGLLPAGLPADWSTWIGRALTFLVISCPCALVISIPLTFFGGIGGASRAGILIKGGNYLEALANTGVAVFDKTGTLTQGVFTVTKATPAPGVTQAQLGEIATLAERFSGHPIAKSLRSRYGGAPGLEATRSSDAKEIAGQGVQAQVDGARVLVGNARLMEENSIDYAPQPEAGTVLYVAKDGCYLGSIVIGDAVKPTAKETIAFLRSQGVRTVMLTGDSEAAAAPVAEALCLDEIHAGLLPADKVAQVERLIAEKDAKKSLLFVGDGINDAPVLMRADVGIAMGALGSDAAIEAADVVLMDDDPGKLCTALRIARKCMAIAYQNIVFALGVKALFLLLGALGIADMWWAVFADVGVMVLAVLNAMRMLNVKKITGGNAC